MDVIELNGLRNYLSAVIAKTGTSNRAEALRIAEAKGWL